MTFLVLVALLSADAGAAASGAQRFERATALMAADRAAEAAAALEALAEELPDDARADDALFLAAQLHEEQLGDPVRARQLYARLVERYPTGREARAAALRADALAAAIGPSGDGAAALAGFNDVKRRFGALGDREAIRRVEALIAGHPDWVGVPEALLWIARVHARAGRHAEAERRFLEIAERWSDEHGFAGYRGAGDAALMQTAYDRAEAHYRRMPIAGDPGRQRQLEDALARVERERNRARWYVTCVAAFALVIAFLLVSLALAAGGPRAAARALWPPPSEAIYFVPVAALLVAAAFTGHALVAPATIIVVIGGLAVIWLSGAGLRAGVRSFPRALAHAAASAVGVAALCYVALHRTRLLDWILETLRYGPDR